MHVPFVDLQTQYRNIKLEVDTAIQGVLDASQYILGPAVAAFEKDFAEYLNVTHVIAVSDGTNALSLALRVLGVGYGDEVILPANTFIATAEAVSLVGATPVFSDIDEKTYHTTAELVAGKITSKTKAIIPVHLYGQSVDMDPIVALGQKHGIPVIEDAAQAHGTLYRDRKAGGLATISCFSFYPGKNLGTYGEGGAVATNDDALAKQARLMRDHGSNIKYNHEVVGGNFRMSGIEGAVLGVKLKHLNEWNLTRRQHADLYRKLLADIPDITLPIEPEYSKGNYHLFVIRTKKRDELQSYLKEKDIQTGIHYPVPIHLQKAYAHLGYSAGDFPVTELVSKEILSLPMYPELTREQIMYVCEQIISFHSQKSIR